MASEVEAKENKFQDKVAKHSRPLGIWEKWWLESERINHWGTVTSVLLIDSAQELIPDQLRETLTLLTKRFPLLRMRIKESRDQAFFEEMENPNLVDFQLLEGIASHNWVEGFENEINSYKFDTARGPLWRARLLKESFNQEKFRNALVLTFHHAICDAMSIFQLQVKLLEILSSLLKGENMQVQSLPLRLGVESMVPTKCRPTAVEKALIWGALAFQLAKSFFSKPKNVYLSTYPPEANSEPSTAKETRFLARSLTKEETELLIKNCKTRKCTVHGALTASIHLAIARILQRKKPELKLPITLNSSYSINLRKECQPTVENDEFGDFATGSFLSIPVPLICSDEKERFWEFACECTREVHAQLESGKHHNLSKLIQSVDPKILCQASNYEFNQGRTEQIFNITNVGALQTNQSDDSPYKFAGSYFGVQCERTGHTFGNNIMTVDGRLYWGVEYFPHVSKKSQAEDFVDLALETLRDVLRE